MPAGDAGLERQMVDTAAIRQRLAEVGQLMQEYGNTIEVDGEVSLAEAVLHLAKSVPLLVNEVDRLQAQVAAVSADLERITADAQYWSDVARQRQAVVDAARWIEEDGWTPVTRGALMEALKQLPADKSQAGSPEGERA